MRQTFSGLPKCSCGGYSLAIFGRRVVVAAGLIGFNSSRSRAGSCVPPGSKALVLAFGVQVKRTSDATGPSLLANAEDEVSSFRSSKNLVFARAAIDAAPSDGGVAYLVGSQRRRLRFRYHCHYYSIHESAARSFEKSVYRTKQQKSGKSATNCMRLRDSTERTIAVLRLELRTIWRPISQKQDGDPTKLAEALVHLASLDEPARCSKAAAYLDAQSAR